MFLNNRNWNIIFEAEILIQMGELKKVVFGSQLKKSHIFWAVNLFGQVCRHNSGIL